MNREIKVEMTSRIVFWTVFYQLRPLLMLLAFVVASLAVASTLLIHTGVVLGWQTFIMPVFFVFFFAWLFFLSYRGTMAQIRKLKTPVFHFRFTDDFLYVKTDLSSGENSWGVFKGIQRNAKVWRIIFQNGTALILPPESLDGDLKAFLSNKLPSLKRTFWKRQTVIIIVCVVIFVLWMYFQKYAHHG